MTTPSEINPFELVLYDKTRSRKGWLGDAISIEAEPHHNEVSTLEFTVASNNRKLGILMEPGARVVCFHRGEQIISGPIRVRGGKGPHSQGTVTFGVEDDYRMLKNVLGWPVPENALNAQTSEYCTVSGPAETVVKNLMTRNAVNRLGMPLTVAPSLGRGANITVAVRMHPILDRIFPAIDSAGIGVTVKQTDGAFVLDCYETTEYDKELTEESGVVTEWSWTNEMPESTRVIVGGSGEGTARAFQSFIHPTRETSYGDVMEVFRDARDTNTAGVFTERAAETFAETAEKSGLSVKFSETANFRYGPGGVRRGNIITLKVGPSLSITDVLRSAVLGWSRDKGPSVQPKVGDVTDSIDQITARAIRRNAADIRNLRSR